MTRPQKPKPPKPRSRGLTANSSQAQVNVAEARGRARMSAAVKRDAERNAEPGWALLAANLDEAIRAIAAEDIRRDQADAL